jgi:glycosyltransferase involved in cell wall biosynthesis
MDIHYLTISADGRAWRDGPMRISAIRKRKLLRRVLGRCYVLDYARVLDALRQIHPDVIYVRNATAYLGMACRYARSSPCTLVWHIASSEDVGRFRLRGLRTAPFDYIDRKMIDYGIRHAHYIIGQARYQDDLLRRNYGRPCDLIVGNWHPPPAQACVKGRGVKIVWIANVKPLKKPEAFVDLADRLGDIEEVEFLMIGRPASGEYQQLLETRIGKVKRLRYLGAKSIDEVNQILAEAHIFVNTSEYEGFPNTFIQAWWREVPVVSLHVDPDDVLKKEGLGLHSGSFETLVRDTRTLIEDRELRARMGAKARAYARENHSLEKNLGRLAALLGI